MQKPLSWILSPSQEKEATKKVIIKWRPGWHIECSACNIKAFWQQIDIHMWWVDLIFPHHQNEIAQTEACTRKEFSKYWMHSWHLMVDGKKMSKSANNFYTLNDLEEKYSPHPNPLPGGEGIKVSRDVLHRAIRLSFINWKYRDSIDFSFEKLEAFFKTIAWIDETIKLIGRELEKSESDLVWITREYRDYTQHIIAEYIECLEDDFNIPEALAVMFKFQKFANSNIKDWLLSHEEMSSILDMFSTFNQVFWIIKFDFETSEIPADIISKFEARNNAKKDKNFEEADKLRWELEKAWYKIIDDRDWSRVEKI